MLKLPAEVRSRFSASSVNTYNWAVEELVYNSIDAKATSIAIRVNIKECVIQVVDNGNGINKTNLKFIGSDHTTSKYEESLVKSAPECYGFKGQALASLIKNTYHVNIKSRSKTSEETWTKSFIEGKEHLMSETDARPSKGTTVELKGFLYNLKIRKSMILELNELNKIKTFLETLTLVHHNISLSLRDDTKNEIVYTAHKNKDIYQSLSYLCRIEQRYFEELQIEKGNYKVKAYLTDKLHKFHWIYLNNRFLTNSRLLKKVNDTFFKYRNKDKKIKKKEFQDELILDTKKIPSYFIFITCPYKEYDISHTPKQTLLEFKNWEDITNLLAKAIQFYHGQLKVKEVDDINILKENKKVVDTRQEVKKIVNRLLGGKEKRNKISQIVTGRKGKFVKRNQKTNNMTFDPIQPLVQKPERKVIIKKPLIKINKATKKIKEKNEEAKKNRKTGTKQPELLKELHRKIRKTKQNPQTTAILGKFKEDSVSVKKRCFELAEGVQNLLPNCQQNQNIIINKNIKMGNFIKNNKQYTVKKHVEEITIETINFENKILTRSDLKYDFERPFHKKQNYNVNNNMKPISTPEELTFASHLRLPIQSFKSHAYVYTHKYNFTSGSPQYLHHKNNDRNFITTESLANFNVYKSTGIKHKPKNNSSLFDASYAIEITTPIKENFTVIDTYQLLNCNFQDFNMNSKEMKYYDFVPQNNQDVLRFKNITINSPKSYLKPISTKSHVLGSTIVNSSNRIENNMVDVESNCFEEFIQHCGTTNIYDKAILDKCKKVMNSTYTLSIPKMSSDVTHVEQDAHNQRYCSLLKQNQSHLNVTQNSNCNVVFISKSQPKNLNRTSADPELDVINTADDQVTHEYSKESGNIFIDTNYKAASQMHELCVDDLIIRIDNIAIASDNDQDLNISHCFDDSGMKNYKSDAEQDPFKMNNRHRFLPKGMSPICLNKTTLDCLNTKFCDNDFFANEIYDDFIDNVKITTTIYEPNVQNMEDFACKNLNKCKNTGKKNSDPLIFTCQSLNSANVLGQVDNKFVAARIGGNYYKTEVSSEFLVLFDQHAIHERINLENNLSDYLIGDQWQTVEIDKIVINFPNDELLYVCNYEAKFKQFGLQWTLLNNHELSVNAIPLAILSKNTRSVDKIMKAVENLILELVESIRSQRSATAYPKSIMDLVFSEACRHAIKFGDKLTYRDCVELIHKLSFCKVPFKCAHGRPVMAVLMEIEKIFDDKYRINLSKLTRFKKAALKKIYSN